MSNHQPPSLPRAAAAEFIATAFLLIAVVGSGIAAERLSGGNVALALLANALATSGALFMLILSFGSLSGAHMNPLVTCQAAFSGELPWPRVGWYVSAQAAGAVIGTWIAHVMFDLPVIQASTHVRTGTGQWLGEVVATFGLLVAIARCKRFAPPVIAGVVAAYIGGAYWFTSSTSFANPAVTFARSLTDTFAGIRPADLAGFVVAQVAGLGLAILVLRWLRDDPPN